MGDTPRHMEKQSSLFGLHACAWPAVVIATAATALLNAASLNTLVAGSAVPGGNIGYCRGFQSVFLTTVSAGITTTFRITGENHLGEPIIEDITIVGSTTAHSLNVYRRITWTTVFAVSGAYAGGDTLSVGYSQTSGMRLPLWARDTPAAVILAVAPNTAAPVTSFTVDGTRRALQLGAAGTTGFNWIMLDPQYMRYL